MTLDSKMKNGPELNCEVGVGVGGWVGECWHWCWSVGGAHVVSCLVSSTFVLVLSSVSSSCGLSWLLVVTLRAKIQNAP